MTKQTTITVDSRSIAAVAKWASTDPGKPLLHMVLFAPNEYVACDGIRLVIVPMAYDGQPFGVDAVHLTAAVAAQRSLIGSYGDLIITPHVDDGVRIALNGAVSISVPLRDPSAYPPYQKVIPTRQETDSPEGHVFDPKYLAAIAEVNEATCSAGDHGVMVTAWSKDRLGPMAFENAGVRFVIMPVRK